MKNKSVCHRARLILVLTGVICMRADARDLAAIQGNAPIRNTAAIRDTATIEKVHIVPEPVSVQIDAGYFRLNSATRIIATGKATDDIAAMLKEMLNGPTGFHLTIKTGLTRKVENVIMADNAIIVKLNATPDKELGEEGYTLEISSHRVVIAANRPQGLFYGMQTVRQLLPSAIESTIAPGVAAKAAARTGAGATPEAAGMGAVAKAAAGARAVRWEMPCVKIRDYPRFGWRGLMLDVSRHFFSKEFVKQYIDEMSKYKFNVFHWHLTDDQGWRIRIEGLPRLTEARAAHAEIGAAHAATGGARGDYYTDEDIHEIVQYAQQRFVTIVPEVDVPAHSLALIAAYPALSCTKQPADNVLCVANDSTWLLLDKIFTRIAALFPGKYIHAGGDEANRTFWEKDPNDLALMQRESLKNTEELQSYFEKKLEKIITSKGKKMIGWDEILQGGIAPEATVMSWRGMQGGIDAARMGHHVVMTPVDHCYLDYYQGDPSVEPSTGGMLRLSTCYGFEPVPAGIDPTYILGGQGNLWTESVSNDRHVEYMTWPRSLALSEVFWSPANQRDWTGFIRRMEWQFQYMDSAHVKYARSVYDPIISRVNDAGGAGKVKLATEIPDLDIYYTFDGSNPDNFYPRYEGEPLSIPAGARAIRVVTYRNGKPIGHQINYRLSKVAN